MDTKEIALVSVLNAYAYIVYVTDVSPNTSVVLERSVLCTVVVVGMVYKTHRFAPDGELYWIPAETSVVDVICSELSRGNKDTDSVLDRLLTLL